VSALLPTKFTPPPAPAGFVARPQLFEKLNEALTRRLTLVSAPAGAGKTTLVSAWVQVVRAQGATFGWLTLDEGDNVPGRFLEYLTACLEEGGALIDSTVLPIQQAEPTPVEAILGDLIRALIHLERELILILDDYHLIQNKEVHTALDYLLDYAPPRLHLVLLTRSDPPLELARRRVTGELGELRIDQLRFSTQEAQMLLEKSAGVQLAEAEVVRLNERAEGWAAGLQLAAISLRGREDASAFVAAFAGSHRFVFDYLLEQVLDRQEPEVREFLLKTSILERFTAPLCEAVAETGGAAQRLLAGLERANLFLMPLDDEKEWYRYHHLFADLLKLVLDQTHPGMAAELHRRAYRWHEEQGMIPEALQHALAAGDMALAARLVSTNVLALVEPNELRRILERMDAAPPKQRPPDPWLGVAHAWALAYTGQMERTETALNMAEERLERLPQDEHQRISGHIAAVRAYTAWVNGSQKAAIDFAGRAAHLLPMGETAVRALNLTTLGNAMMQYKADPGAVEVLEQAAALARLPRQSHVFMPAATALAYAYTGLGALHKAYTVCQEAIEFAETFQRHNHQPLPAAASAYAELANIQSEWGEIERSIQTARRGLALSEQWGQVDTTMLCLLALANSLSLARDNQAAQIVLQRARKTANQVSPWFVLNVDQIEVRIWLDTGNIAQALRVVKESRMALPASLEARLLLKQNCLDQVLSRLESVLPEVEQSPSLESVRLGALQSLALFLKKDEDRALAALRWTLELAEPENRVMIFVREGAPMERLLQLGLAKSICPVFIRRLLAAFEARRRPDFVPAVETLIEPLSERELEVLALLNGPLSTPEMAEKLVVSVNTVRTHIKNIYGKLGVQRRSAAVKRAKELRLLE
jgi:LuxR family maltose regulon positive regulatory protein